MRKQANGLKGEEIVYQYLCSICGRDVHKMPYNSYFDMLVDGIRVEVKTGKPRIQNKNLDMISWQFNIHRHGKMPEKQPDCYVLRLEDVPYSDHAIHLLYLGPLTIPTIYISIRSLLAQRHYKEAGLFADLAMGNLKLP